MQGATLRADSSKRHAAAVHERESNAQRCHGGILGSNRIAWIWRIMHWDEEIDHPETHELVQRRAYIFGDGWSWLLRDTGAEMTLGDNPGDFRVRQSRGRWRILARAKKAARHPSRLGQWTVSFPEESGREPYVAGPRNDAILWMRTALHFDPHADEATRCVYDPERVARQWDVGPFTLTEAEQAETRNAAELMESILDSPQRRAPIEPPKE
jgi:hypothetical protein